MVSIRKENQAFSLLVFQTLRNRYISGSKTNISKRFASINGMFLTKIWYFHNIIQISHIGLIHN